MLAIEVKAAAAIAQLDDVAKNQVPFAMAGAINDTAVDFQLQEFLHETDIFTVRRPDWLQRSNKITHFARKYEGELYATITVSPPGDANRADIVSKFEDQTTKQSSKSGGLVAIPINARRNKRDIITGKDRPRAFHFRQQGNRIIGDNHTFIITLKDGRKMIMQRRRTTAWARKKLGYKDTNQVWPLYILVPQVRITPDLQWAETARWAVEHKFQANFDKRWAQALETAR